MSNTKTGFLVYILCKQCNGNTKECMECKKLGYHLYIISDDPIKSGDKIYVDDINGHERSILTAASDILTYQEGIYTREYVKLAPNSHGWISARIQHDGVKKVIHGFLSNSSICFQCSTFRSTSPWQSSSGSY